MATVRHFIGDTCRLSRVQEEYFQILLLNFDDYDVVVIASDLVVVYA